jgi:hypothetical protein
LIIDLVTAPPPPPPLCGFWVVLDEGKLDYFSADPAKEKLGTIDLYHAMLDTATIETEC